MAVIQIVGNQSGSGRTSVASALLVTAQAAGKKAAYYKPTSPQAEADPDVAYVSQLITEGPAVPAPQTSPPEAQVQEAVAALESQADVVIVEGPDSASPLTINSNVVFVFGPAGVPGISGATGAAGDNLAAIIVNAVPIHRRDQLAHEIGRQSVPVAVIPESRGMLSVTVEQLAEHIGGQWVLDPVNTDAPVERVMIGGNILDEGPTYFGRYANQAVITRVERPDIQMACMGGGTRCLVLTGPGEPTEYIKAEALQREVPLIQVRTNTHDTAESLSGLLDKADARTAVKAAHFAELLERWMGADSVNSLLS